MTVVALPTIATSRRWVPWAVASAFVISLLMAGGYWLIARDPAVSGAALDGAKFFTVTSADMDVKVKKDGEIQAVDNIDILCQVEGVNTIVQLVKEGIAVKKGDTLVVFDTADLRQKIEDAELTFEKADSDLKNSQELKRIQENQNAADIEAAEITRDLAKLALREYSEGTYPESLAAAQTALKMADITVRNKEEELEQTKALFTKGFVTAAQVKADELSVTTVNNDLRKAETSLKVLTEFTNPTEEATKKSDLSQAEQKLARVRITATSALSQKISGVQAAEASLLTAKRKLAHLQEQLAACTIKAPADGMVVYAANDRSAQNGIQEGTQVRERQLLLRLPDTSRLKAVVRVSESQVTRLALDQRATVRIVGVADPIPATLSKKSPLADSGSRWWNPDLKEYPVELTLDHSPSNCLPGMGAQTEIFIDRLEEVLAIPVAAVYSERGESWVFTRQGDDVKAVKVKIGETNDTHAQITDGLSAGEQVLILQAGQGRELLERFGIRPAEPKKDKRLKGKLPAGPIPTTPPEVKPKPSVSAAISLPAPHETVPSSQPATHS